uniref:Myb/SANT-like DNA-binding domain-containing protein n=1 Tax=Pelusios castaneus TaxID=367368 RepID=A0A8C8T0I4_9SAUR
MTKLAVSNILRSSVAMAAHRGRRTPLWSTAEVLDLISIWGESALQAQLRGSRRNDDIYGIISRAMSERGYDRDTVQCRSKVKELRITYHRAKEANRRSGSAPATCRYSKEIEAILSGDPTTTAKSPVDTLAPPPHPVNARPEQDENVMDEEEEMEADLEESATACSQEVFCTPAETSTQDMNCSVSSEVAEGGSGKFLFRAAMAPAKISLSRVGVLAVSVPAVHTLYSAFIRSASTQAVTVKKSSVFRLVKVSSMYLQSLLHRLDGRVFVSTLPKTDTLPHQLQSTALGTMAAHSAAAYGPGLQPVAYRICILAGRGTLRREISGSICVPCAEC